MTAISIDPERLLADLQELRSFGACDSGVVRPAFSEEDMAARRWLAGRMTEAGLVARFDPVGNLFGLPPGDGEAILIGSHGDTQPEGGWLDGAYGTIAGLEIARASREQDGPPVACVALQNEEGRFSPYMGSHYLSGAASLAKMDAMLDLKGETFGQARATMEELRDAKPQPLSAFSAFLEIHIEQGPVLDRHDERIGVVEAIVGLRQFQVTIEGEQNHAGTTPMPLRRDAFTALRRFSTKFEHAFAELCQPSTVWTIGHVVLHPNAPSVVPGRASFTLQFRDSSIERLGRLEEAARHCAHDVEREKSLSVSFAKAVAMDPAQMDESLVAQLSDAAEALAPGKWRLMPSGALHDATNMAPQLPTAMLFVPSLRGVSHSFDEDTRHEDLVLGVQVLAEGASRIAGGADEER